MTYKGVTVDQMMGNVPDEDEIGSKPMGLNKQPKRVPVTIFVSKSTFAWFKIRGYAPILMQQVLEKHVTKH